MIDKRQDYNVKYNQPNYFHYREWLYAPYISSLVSLCELAPGALVLDVGCGQGFFSHLFHKCGMRVHGIDMSEVGVRMARTLYGEEGVTFSVADINTAMFAMKFDCIFVRSCSLYNTGDFATRNEVTDKLLRHLKEDGVFIFAYYTTFSGKVSSEWRYHSLREVSAHFNKYATGTLLFCTKIDTLLIRRWAFNSLITRLNTLLSKVFGIGGDVIYVLGSAEELLRQ